MKRILVLSALALVFAATVRAGEQTVSFKSGDEQATGLLVTPEGKGPFPASIVIQEWWGLNDWVKDQARALAKEGLRRPRRGPLPRQGRRRRRRTRTSS